MLKVFSGKGFKVEKYNFSRKKFKLDISKYGAYYELLGWRKKRNMRYRRRKKPVQLPEKFFKKVGKVELRGHTYTCMFPPKEYLTYKYGQWNRAMRSADSSKYLSSKFRRKPKFRYRMRKFLRPLITGLFSGRKR